MNNLTLGSLFDGSGGFPLGGLISGIAPLWASEIEPFPIRVTTKRLPFMKHYGDVSALNGAELPPVDIITFGSPCQDMSIAGKREGLDGNRSGLFYEAVRIVKEMRCATDGKYPRYIVWENVPGAFSSNKGEDFKAVLDEICRVKDCEADTPRPKKWPGAGCIVADDYSVAWRVFDAQYWGVPQRRARIYLVADFAGGSAPEVLFKSEGLSGYTPQGFRSWEGAAGGAEEGAGTAGGRADSGSGRYCLNVQGCSGVTVTEEMTGTLVAQDHGNHPAVLQAAGFSTEHSAKARSIGYEEEVSPTLRAGVVPAAMLFDNHPQDCRYDGPLEESPTVTARYGTGGNNQPLVAAPEPITLKIRSGCEGGGKGVLCQQDKSATLGTHNDQTLFQPKAYGVCSKSSHAMLSDNPKSGFYEAKTSRTLDQSGGNAVTSNQGGICIVAPDPAYALQGSMIGRKDKNGPQGSGVNEEVSFTLNTIDREAVAAPTGEHYSASKNSFFTQAVKEQANTLVATDYKDPPTVSEEPYYIVRRLTPTECARLQGFPDWWCDDLGTDEPTDEDVAFWREVFETHRKVMGTSSKPKTDAQIIKWLKEPHADSAEYKLWGNGVALPCVHFVLSGIVYYSQFPTA